MLKYENWYISPASSALSQDMVTNGLCITKLIGIFYVWIQLDDPENFLGVGGGGGGLGLPVLPLQILCQTSFTIAKPIPWESEGVRRSGPPAPPLDLWKSLID